MWLFFYHFFCSLSLLVLCIDKAVFCDCDISKVSSHIFFMFNVKVVLISVSITNKCRRPNRTVGL